MLPASTACNSVIPFRPWLQPWSYHGRKINFCHSWLGSPVSTAVLTIVAVTGVWSAQTPLSQNSKHIRHILQQYCHRAVSCICMQLLLSHSQLLKPLHLRPDLRSQIYMSKSLSVDVTQIRDIWMETYKQLLSAVPGRRCCRALVYS